jgi:hypothetical protein
MSPSNIMRIIAAGIRAWTQWQAIMKEGVSISDPRTLKQAQLLASAIVPVITAVGLAVPIPYVQAGSLVALVIYGIWNALVTTASTEKIGIATAMKPPSQQEKSQAEQHGDMGGIPAMRRMPWTGEERDMPWGK